MTVLKRIAYYQDRRDEVPNRELARELAEREDLAGIQEIADNLWHTDPSVQSDCLKVLYEIGYLKPELVASFTDDYLRMLRSKNNRLVWGAMIALATVAALRADALYPHAVEIQGAMDGGSVITRDNGVKVLAAIAAQKREYRDGLFPYLLHHLETCRPKDVPQRAESILPAVDAGNRQAFTDVLQVRMEDLSASQIARVKRVIKIAEARS